MIVLVCPQSLSPKALCPLMMPITRVMVGDLVLGIAPALNQSFCLIILPKLEEKHFLDVAV